MIKAKQNGKIVKSYKNLSEACSAMVKSGIAASENSARWNIASAMNGREIRNDSAATHNYARHTAYGFTWNETKR